MFLSVFYKTSYDFPVKRRFVYLSALTKERRTFPDFRMILKSKSQKTLPFDENEKKVLACFSTNWK